MGIKHQAAGALSRFPTKGADVTVLDDEVPVCTLTADQFLPGEADEGFMDDYDENHGGDFVPFLPEFFTLAELMPADEINMPNSYEFITAQSMDPECQRAV